MSSRNLVLKNAARIKHLYAAVTRIRYMDQVFAVDGNAVGPIAIGLGIKKPLLMGYGLFTTKGQAPFIARCTRHKFLHITSLPVRDIHVTLTINRHMGGF